MISSSRIGKYSVGPNGLLAGQESAILFVGPGSLLAILAQEVDPEGRPAAAERQAFTG
jgi:hypothetical protein